VCVGEGVCMNESGHTRERVMSHIASSCGVARQSSIGLGIQI